MFKRFEIKGHVEIDFKTGRDINVIYKNPIEVLLRVDAIDLIMENERCILYVNGLMLISNIKYKYLADELVLY